MSKVKKAIIPAAGLGTRFLPATKTVPKEMLTIVDAPIIFYVVEEALNAGIEDIVLIQGRGKSAIEDFFDTSYELEDKLAKDGKFQLLERLTRIREMVNIISIRQKQPLGLGHSVLCGQTVIGDSPFAVLLGDEIMYPRNGGPNTTANLCRLYEELNSSVVAIMEVPPNDVSKYGIADVTPFREGLFKVNSFVEKPKKELAPSRWALPGLRNGKPGANGEIQLTDSMNAMTQKQKFYASTFTAQRFDAGDKFGYLRANVELGLMNPELRAEFSKYLIEVGQRLQNEAGQDSKGSL